MSARLRVAVFGAAATLSALAVPAGVPATLLRAKVETREVAPGELARTMRDLAAGATRWIAWKAPIEDPTRQMCCFDCADGRDGAAVRSASAGCRLGGRGMNFNSRDERAPIRLEDPADFLIFVRASGGRIDEIRTFSFDCPIDAEGKAVVWLDGVRPEESVAWLETLLPSKEAGGELSNTPQSAIAAIAFHAGPAADSAMRRAIAPFRPIALRDRAAFWLAAGRGASGCTLLEKTVPGDADARFRERSTFPLSRCRDEAAVSTLFSMARRDAASEVRSRALFWLAHEAGRKAAAAIDDAIRDDPDTEVKKQAVFALTQMPEDEGVPQLIRVARTNRNPEVRERAVFWLGQSKDPRALDFIEEVLTK
ncbi:MAG TPA: HEAT repeat domain-containing protein [Thermoanaerobaculia bacterium]